MIGAIAYERKPGGRRLGTIVGQRTVPNAQGVPTGQWEIRTAGGIRFFMSKADVRAGLEGRTSSEPEPEPAPAPAEPAESAEPLGVAPVVPPVAQAAADLQGPADAGAAVREEVVQFDRELIAKRRRSVLPVVVTLLGVALCVASGVLLALRDARKLAGSYEVIVRVIPGLVGLLVILIGTGLVGERAKGPGRRRRK